MTQQKHHNQPTHTSEGFSRSQRFYLTLAVILTTIILYAGYSTLAGTNIATTLNLTGPGTTLDDGLVGHWTFDGIDMDFASTTGEVLDRSGNGNIGNFQTGGAGGSVTRESITYTDMGNGETFNMPATRPDDDLYVLFASSDANDPISAPAGWTTLAADENPAGDTMYNIVAWRIGSSEPATYNLGGDITDGKVHVVRYSGIDTTTPINQFDWDQADTGTSATAPAVTPNVADTRILRLYMNDGGDTWTVPDQIFEQVSSGEISQASGEEAGPASGVSTGVASATGFDDNWFAATLAIAPASDSVLGKTALGAIGQALSFDGVDDTIMTTADLSGTQVYTVSFWLYVDGWTENANVYADWDGVAEYDGISITPSEDGTICGAGETLIIIRTNEGGPNYFCYDRPSAGEWHHWSVIGDTAQPQSGEIRFFLDGVEQAYNVNNGIGNPAGVITGDTVSLMSEFGNDYFMSGKLDDVRIHDRVLTPDEIKQLYRQGATTKIATTPEPKGPAVTLDTGLVGHWTFDGPDMEWDTASSEVRDISPEGNHGALRGILGTDTVVPGALGQALVWDGINDNPGIDSDYVEIPRDSAFEPSDAITVSAWARFDDFSSGGAYKVVTKSYTSGGSPFQSYSLGENLNGTISFEVNIDGTLHLGPNSSLLPEDEWVHLVGTWEDGDYSKLYVNGELDVQSGSTYSGSLTYYDMPLVIGNGINENDKEILGAIDDVRIYNRQLSPDEIKQLYRQGATTKVATTPEPKGPAVTLDTGLVGHWTFDGPDMEWDTASSEVRDISLENNHAELNGTLGTMSVGPGVMGQSLSFDGVGDFVEINGDPPEIQLDTNFTLSAWIKPDIAKAGVVIKGGAGSSVDSRQQYSIEIETGGVIEFATSDGTSGDKDTYGTVTLGEWSHIVCTHGSEGGDKICYLNGEQSGSTQTDDLATPYSESKNFYAIGGEDSNGGTYFDGAIDDVRIYNRQLSPDEIKQLYRMGQ